MFVRCKECSQHYDDATEKPDCNGAGSAGGHMSNGKVSSIVSHVIDTRKSRFRELRMEQMKNQLRLLEDAE